MHGVFSFTSFLVLWIFGSLASVFSTLFISGLIAVVAGIILWGIFAVSPIIGSLIMVMTIGVFFGFITGVIQRELIYHTWRARLTGWRILSVIGGAIGYVLASIAVGAPLHHFITNLTIPDEKTAIFIIAMPVLIPVAIMSTLQAIALFRYVRYAWLWIVANVVGILAMVPLLYHVVQHPVSVMSIGFIILAFCTPAIVTGVTIIALFQWQAKDYYRG